MRFGLRFFAFGVFLWLGGAALGLAAPMPDAVACGAAGLAAERQAGLPANLLVSIGLVESGGMAAPGRRAAWPWTVNVDGAGHYFADEPDAAAFARAAQGAGARDVDVGCFQISLQYHPDAFASLDAAFDPAGNAGFAARFLNELKAQTGSWGGAIADYHSAWPEFGAPYRRRVLAAWQSLGGLPAGLSPLTMLPDFTVILEAPAARRVRVITMDGESGPPDGWLPRVITP